MKTMTLKILSEELRLECGNCLDRFYEMRERDHVPDFYTEVKPYADHWHAEIEKWREQSAEYIKENRPKHVHFMQIENAAEGMTQFFVQSFFKETSKKRFIQTIQAAQFTIQSLIMAIDERSGAQ
ncbi:YppE family protein [Planomicrobium sp. YIM 101495]|uniref:YppE family protein n=1 Tax=Planomicrobium sp. YIM 101495 TaxID=2665160 RepID=UPI001E588119|nr:YppE family protein [Planomicrobium sp. YIM 101495]